MNFTPAIPCRANHFSKWTIYENNLPKCLACVMEFCSNVSNPNVKKQFFIKDFIEILKLNRSNIAFTLQSSLPESEIILQTFLGLINHEDVYLSNLVSDGIILVLNSVKNVGLVHFVLEMIFNQMTMNCNFQQYLPFINLTAALLNKFPFALHNFMPTYGNIVENIVVGLNYPNEAVKKSILELLIPICRQELDRLSAEFKPHLIREVMKILKDEQSEVLLSHALSLIMMAIKDEMLFEHLFNSSSGGATLPLVLKRILMVQNTKLQFDCSQCLILAVGQKNFDVGKAEFVMECDLLEILFQILSTQNLVLIDSILNCITYFTNYEKFFLKCHVIFGIDPILRCIEHLFAHKCVVRLPLALRLLQNIFQKTPPGVTLFTHSQTVEKVIKILKLGINSDYRDVSLEATIAFQYFLRKEYMHSPVPFKDIQIALTDCSKNTLVLFESQTRKSVNELSSVEVELPEMLFFSKLSVISSAITLIHQCLQDPSCFEDSFKAPGKREGNFAAVQEMVSVILQELNTSYLPIFFKCSVALKNSKSYLLLITSIIQLDEVSPDVMKDYFISLCKNRFLEWLCDLRRFQASSELKETCNTLLQIVLTSLTQDCNSSGNRDEFPIYDFSNLDGTLENCISILLDCDNSFWVDDNKLSLAHSTILAAVYYNKFYSNNNVIRPITLIQILSRFIRSCSRLESLPLVSFKHLLFLFAVADEETEGVNSNLIEPTIPILCQILQSCPFPLASFYTHNNALLKWVFSYPKIAECLGKATLTEWIRQKSMETMKDNDFTLIKSLLCKNEYYTNAFLDLLASSNATNLWNVMIVILNNLQTPLELETQSLVMKKFCDISESVKGQALDEITENLLFTILKLFYNVDSNNNDMHILELKTLQQVCNVLPESKTVDFASTCYHYMINIVTVSCERKDTRFLAVTFTWPNIKENIYKLCFEENNPIQYLALNLLSDLIRYQHYFKIQVNWNLKLELETFIQPLTSRNKKVIQSAIYLITSLLDTSFNSSVLSVENLFDQKSEFNPLRLVYIHLLNSSMKVDGFTQETIFRCIYQFLMFAQNFNGDLASHLMTQPWIGIVFKSQIHTLFAPESVEMRKLLYLFVEYPLINKPILGFINKCMQHPKFNQQAELSKELLTKISRSIYYAKLKANITNYLHVIDKEE